MVMRGSDVFMGRMDELKQAIAQLPAGCVSRKTIHGKTQYYRQWTENGKVKSKYIPEAELSELQQQIQQRRALQAELRALKESVDAAPLSPVEKHVFQLSVVYGEQLRQMVAPVASLQKRDCFAALSAYINGRNTARVCILYGLRRTGKTTLLWQLLQDMPEEMFEKSVYIKAQRRQTMRMLDTDLKALYHLGFRYVLIDEVTFLEDFIDTASFLSDIYAATGMKIVLSGTDSLGLWFAGKEELYDRNYLIHTTWIPYPEHARLLGDTDIDDYIRYGGTLRIGETDFDDPELKNEEVAFRNDETTRRYIDTAICKNIQHSLKCYEDGEHFRHLQQLYECGELTGAINRVIESMNHRFTLDVLTRAFKSGDLSLARKNLLRERDLALRTDILDRVSTENITARLMEIPEIQNASAMKVELTEDHVREIEEYLYALELIDYCPIRYARPGSAPDQSVIITQPGMRYCQALALIHSLMKDPVFDQISDAEKSYVTERICDEVKGRMMEEIIHLETMRTLKDADVFKFMFDAGEFDMVVFDHQANTCRIYEIKHSTVPDIGQTRHLIDPEKLEQTEKRIAPISGRYVIYRGPNTTDENGIQYLNIADYLRGLS